MRKMNNMQRAGYLVLIEAAYRVINAPTGSGKSALITFIEAQELGQDPDHRCVIAVPQKVIGKGFRASRLQYPDKVEREWKLGYDLTGDREPDCIGQVLDFLSGSTSDNHHNSLLCSHAALARAYSMLKNKSKCLRNITVWVDEAHHVLVSEGRDREYGFVCNQLGNLVKYLLDLRSPDSRVGLATAFFFRGDQASIIPRRYLEEFARYHLPLDEHWQHNIKHIKSYKYDFVVFKSDYLNEIAYLFKRRLGKTIIYLPWPNASVSQGCKYTECKKIINAITKVKPSARVLDLVDETDRDRKRQMFYQLDALNNIDVILTLGMLREGADWIWADRVIDLAPTNSLSLAGQKFGRLIRDVPGKKTIEYNTVLPFVLDNLDHEAYRKRLSERFTAFTASLLIDDLISPVKLPVPRDFEDRGHKRRKNSAVSFFELAVPDETERHWILQETVDALIDRMASNEEAVERGERPSKVPASEETDLAIEEVLRKAGVKRYRKEVLKHIKLLLSRRALKRASIDITSCLEDFDLVNQYLYSEIMSFGAGVCNCRTFQQLRSVLNKKMFYKTPEEWKSAVDRLGIKSNPEYRRRFRADPRLHSNPDVLYGRSWAELIGWKAPPEPYSLEDWRRLVIDVKKVKTLAEYRHKCKEDPRLIYNAERHYGLKWNELMRRPAKYKKPEDFLAAVKGLRIRSQKEYARRYKEDQRLPAIGSFYYGLSWNQIHGRTRPSKRRRSRAGGDRRRVRSAGAQRKRRPRSAKRITR